MRGARRRPYVDRVKPGNDADARPGRNPKGRGVEQRLVAIAHRPWAGWRKRRRKRLLRGAFRCREPLQYRHIAAGSPPRTASHIASVAHVPIIEIGSSRCAVFEPGRERFIMSISHNDIGDNLRRIVITGRLDMPGTDSVASTLGELVAAPKKGVVVDLSSVKFLASIGIRALITSAKTVQQRGGKMVLVVSGGSSVVMSLEATGVDQLIPVFRNNADAERAAVA